MDYNNKKNQLDDNAKQNSNQYFINNCIVSGISLTQCRNTDSIVWRVSTWNDGPSLFVS